MGFLYGNMKTWRKGAAPGAAPAAVPNAVPKAASGAIPETASETISGAPLGAAPGGWWRPLAVLFLAGALAAGAGIAPGPFPPLVPAYAAEGAVTIAAKDGHGVEYDVYQVFSADVSDGSGDAPDRMASRLKWADDAVKEATLSFLAGASNPASPGYDAWLVAEGHLSQAQADAASGGGKDVADAARANPQNAAEYVSAQVTASAADDGAGTDPETKRAGSFADAYARALSSSGLSPQVAHAGEAFTSTEGLYLFVTRPASIGDGGAGTAPMWVPLGSATRTITEKTATGTLSKTVADPAGGGFGKGADAANGEDVAFKVTTTMPANIGAYAGYHWKVTDTPAPSMELAGGDASSVKVTVGGRDVTSLLTGAKGSIAYAEGVLTVEIADLKALEDGLAIDGDTVVEVVYGAHRMPGTAGSDASNAVVYTHTADPVSGRDSTDAAGGEAHLYGYRLTLAKVDKSTAEALPGAGFTLQAAPSHPVSGVVGKFVQADGTLGVAAHEFETDASGSIVVPALGAGVYTVHEAHAPEGYAVQGSDIELTVSPAFDAATGELRDLAVSVTGGEFAEDASEVSRHVESVDAATCSFTVVAPDAKNSIALPLTGRAGDVWLRVLAAGVAAVSLALLARRKGGEGSDSGRRFHPLLRKVCLFRRVKRHAYRHCGLACTHLLTAGVGGGTRA